MAMKSYCLKKMPEKLWEEVDKNRLALCGTLSPQGTTRADYLREAIIQYNKWNSEVVMPRVASLKSQINEPVMFYVDDGLDIQW